jgi:hypothetical protein
MELQKMIEAEMREEKLREDNLKKEANLRKREQERIQYMELKKKKVNIHLLYI